jgi:DNA-binding LacI/PurR family transcriptional regulator
VEHLIALGHQQIALLAGPLSSVSARLRLADWHKYLTRNQIHPIAEREGDWSAMSGFQQTMQMLNEGIVPTAMLVANDQMALGAMRAITESGLRVGDISVVGYDDTEDSSCYIPPLTTIKQDFRLLGKTSVDRLLKLSGPGGEEQSAVARLTGEKKNHPTAHANHLSPHVGRFLNAAGTTSFPT